MTRPDCLALMAAFFLATGDEKTDDAALARAEALHKKARELSKGEWAGAVAADAARAAEQNAGPFQGREHERQWTGL